MHIYSHCEYQRLTAEITREGIRFVRQDPFGYGTQTALIVPERFRRRAMRERRRLINCGAL